MEPLYVSYVPELTEAGTTVAREGTYDIAGYESGDSKFIFREAPHYDIMLTHTGEGILATGMVEASVQGACDRCLADSVFDVSGEIQGYYLFQEPDPSIESDEDDHELVASDDRVDISRALMSAIIMDTPFVTLCKEDCAGLCPDCGADLNKETCDCRSDDRIDPMNPFAVLAGLDLEEK